MFRSFIKVTALCLILISTFFLIKAGLGLSAKDIFELSATPYGRYNDKLVQNLTQQKSDTIVGFVLMLLCFILSLIDLLMPMYCDEFAMNRKGLIAAIVVSIIIFFVAYATSCFLQNKRYKEVQGFYWGRLPIPAEDFAGE